MKDTKKEEPNPFAGLLIIILCLLCLFIDISAGYVWLTKGPSTLTIDAISLSLIGFACIYIVAFVNGFTKFNMGIIIGGLITLLVWFGNVRGIVIGALIK